jgi:LacI family transcriptional regulator
MRRLTSGSATLRGVAANAGVSTMTVSRVLNNPDRVSEPTRRRVEAALSEAGYAPDHIARQLAVGTSKSAHERIALVCSRSMLPRLGAYFAASLAFANHLGHLLVPAVIDDPKQARKLIEGLHVDRIVALPDAGPIIAALSGTRLPIVAVMSCRRSESVTSVGIDEARAVNEVVQHLSSAGHHHIAIISGPCSEPACPDYVPLFDAACRNASIEASYAVIERADHVSCPSVMAGAVRLLASPFPPTALLITDEDLVDPVRRAVLERVPLGRSGVQLCVLDDYGTTQASDHMTIFSAPIDAICREAIRAALQITASHSPRLELPSILLPRTLLRA